MPEQTEEQIGPVPGSRRVLIESTFYKIVHLTLVSLPAGDKDALQRHDVRGRGEQRAVHQVLQAARCRGSLPGRRLEALQVQQEQPRQDGHAGGGMTRGPARSAGASRGDARVRAEFNLLDSSLHSDGG